MSRPRSLGGRALDRLLERQTASAGALDGSNEALRRRLNLAARLPAYAARDLSGPPIEALRRQPLLTRADLADPRRFVDPRWPAPLLWTARSSGSSGQPLAVRRDVLGAALEQAFLRRQLRAFGWSEGWRSLVLRADGPRDPKGPVFDWDPRRGERRVAASRLDGPAVVAIIERLHQDSIQLVRAYPSAVIELARRAAELGLADRLQGSPVRLLHLSSETLDEASEARLRAAFGAEIADHYGQVERALLVQSCPLGARHLITDYAVAEQVEGRWVGTPLFGCGVLLRYDTGDLCGALSIPEDSQCGCGWPFPRVGRVVGRQDDVIETSDGRRVGRLGPALRAIEGVDRIQVEQRATGELLVRLLPTSAAAPGVAGDVTRALRDLLCDDVLCIEVRLGEAPRPGPGGKIQAVIRGSAVDQDK